MSDTDKKNTKDVSKSELHIREGDIVWHSTDKYIGEVTSIYSNPTARPKPIMYITGIAGRCIPGNDVLPEELELLLSKDQIQYEVATSDNNVKAFYKGKLILDLTFPAGKADQVLYYVKCTVRRNYLYNQLLEMYPDSKISKVIDIDYY